MSEMNKLKVSRTPARTSFTKIGNALEISLQKETKDFETIEIQLAQLENKYVRLHEIDQAILELLLDDEEAYSNEFEAIEEYNDRYLLLKKKCERLHSPQETTSEHAASEMSSRHGISKRNYKLPKIELKKFKGDVKDWLSFWGQFQKIDSDTELVAEDKFQYLVQATETGSRARELVESYPPSAENYPLAIESLKRRFGREELLVETYVRELLGLVLQNYMNSNQKLSPSKLYDKIDAHLRSLETLKVTKDKYAAMLFPLVESCLPVDVIKAWQRTNRNNLDVTINGDEDPNANKLDSLMKFLRLEVESEESLALAKDGFGLNKKNANKTQTSQKANVPTAVGLFTGNKPTENKLICSFCDNKHVSQDCPSAAKITVEAKREILSKKGCCFICLKPRHTANNCPRRLTCSKCQKRHFEIMCPGPTTVQNLSPDKSSEEKPIEKIGALTNRTCTSKVILQTLVVLLRGSEKDVRVKALIDHGSQRSYISQTAAEQLNFAVVSNEEMDHCLFGGIEVRQKHRCYRVILSDMAKTCTYSFKALDQKRICVDLPETECSSWSHELQERKIEIPGITFSKIESMSEVHLLIGADIIGKLYTGKIEQLPCGLTAIETTLGWTLIGKLPEISPVSSCDMSVLSLHVRDNGITELWNLETLGICDPAAKELEQELKEQALEYFNRSISRTNDGRVEVSLPWIEGHPFLPTNRNLAQKRLKTAVKSLQIQKHLANYQAVFDDWEREQIIERVPQTEVESEESHYLAHRAVVKEGSTTRIRPVFDGSAKMRGHPSLNDCIYKGPNLIEQIPSILNRFRLGRIGVTADIKGAFLQIALTPKDRNFLRFLWWKDGDPEKLVMYRHCRVPFGVTASPFLLGATLNHVLDQTAPELTKTAQKLKMSMYVDNCVASMDTEEELYTFVTQSREIMASALFDLRVWKYSSCFDVNTKRVREATLPFDDDFTPGEKVPVLGLLWNLDQDSLKCDLKGLLKEEKDQIVTKRQILSLAQRVFDPIGFICPVMLIPKLLLQECWKLKLSWDAEVPEDIVNSFVKWKEQLNDLEYLEIPRCIFYSKPTNISLHVFCDASQCAYATCIYIRTEANGGVHCQLLGARARVAPLKQVTIPRLELLACCIGTRLSNSMKKDMAMENVTTYYWSDSMNALYWIHNEGPWAVFVHNRVTEIRSLTEISRWNHVSGTQNPADLPSRGCHVKDILKEEWCQGPKWLYLHPDEWPKTEIKPKSEVVDQEKKKVIVSAMNSCKNEEPFYLQMTSYNKMTSTLAWVYRFANNCRKDKQSRILSGLSAREILSAERSLIKLVQKESFTDLTDKHLLLLKPILDADGLIRTKTRLFQRQDSDNFRCPVVLPSGHYVVKKLIEAKHKENSHCGIQTLMTILRENYWILKGRQTIRSVVKGCVRCQRFDSKKFEVLSPPLPEERVRDALVFEISGVDLAGPLYLKCDRKAWIVLFTCAIYRAVHLELVTSLDSPSFLQALRRFIARRGRPKIMYSDNGSNFVGANSAFQEINWDELLTNSVIKQIEWRFIPPASPWWGGWWERLVGLMKQILKKVLGNAVLTYEEMNTILCDCESVLNARPLTYVSEDSDVSSRDKRKWCTRFRLC